MATYKQIQNFVQEHHCVNVQTCWIAHMKEKCGLPRRKAPNRISEDSRVKPCPPEYEKYIEDAYKHFRNI